MSSTGIPKQLIGADYDYIKQCIKNFGAIGQKMHGKVYIVHEQYIFLAPSPQNSFRYNFLCHRNQHDLVLCHELLWNASIG